MKKSTWIVESIFLLLVVIVLALPGIWERGFIGGKSSTSPNGVFTLSITRLMDAGPGNPYRIVIRRIQKDQVVMKLDYFPGATTQSADTICRRRFSPFISTLAE